LADFQNQAPRFYWYLLESFLKSELERTMPFQETAFGELIGDRFGESRTENFYSPDTLPESH
jgi:hypothetical protein